MKNKIAVLSLALASSVFALDEYLPVAPQTLELDAGISHLSPEVGDAALSIPLQAKYGVMPGMDLELALNYGVSGSTGLAQPELAAKYAIGATGIAAFVNLLLPVATGDKDVPGSGLGIAPGAVFGKNYDKVQAVAMAYYQINMEDDGVTPDNIFRLYLKPGYMVNEKLAGYVGLDYAMQGDANSTKLVPGLTYVLSPALALEANVPVVIAESNVGKSWGIWASVYYTLPL